MNNRSTHVYVMHEFFGFGMVKNRYTLEIQKRMTSIHRIGIKFSRNLRKHIVINFMSYFLKSWPTNSDELSDVVFGLFNLRFTLFHLSQFFLEPFRKILRIAGLVTSKFHISKHHGYVRMFRAKFMQ